MLSILRLACYRNYDSVITSAKSRHYAFKSDLKITWVRPEKIACTDPRKSGDRETVQMPNLNEFPHIFREIDELKNCDELVQSMFSLKSIPRHFTTEVIRENMKNRVRRHLYDDRSMETKIAAMTGRIRCLQEIIKEHPHDKRCKVFLKELIDKRKKFLKYLRRWDYKRFEWILEKLNIGYKPPPNEFHWVTRKESLQKLTNKYCDDLKAERLKAYESILKSQQEDFLKKKILMMEQIRKEQSECGVVVTISEQDIKDIKTKLEQIKH